MPQSRYAGEAIGLTGVTGLARDLWLEADGGEDSVELRNIRR